MLFENISTVDSEVFNLILKEEQRQREGIELIASENFVPFSILQANGSVFTNKYSEGYPGKRYYGGNSVVDELEKLCQKRALELFDLDANIWGVNVQALSGSPANFAVYTALAGPNGKIMGLDLPCGGHLTHGYQSKTKKISATSLFFQSFPYKTGKDDLIDFEDAKKRASDFKPEIIICGFSAYPRDIDYKSMRELADLNNSFLMADISHINGFISSGLLENPFRYADVVTTTTHKILRGPRGALIFYKKNILKNNVLINIEEKINSAVFPGLQGGPHNQTICAIAVACKMAATNEYKQYAKAVIQNAKILANILLERGYKLITGGTDTHLLLVDLTGLNITGDMVEKACEAANITLNKNCIPSSSSPLNPSGIRIGTSAMTTRGATEEDFTLIGDFIDQIIKITVQISANAQKAKKTSFQDLINQNMELKNLRERIILFSNRFPYPCSKYT